MTTETTTAVTTPQAEQTRPATQEKSRMKRSDRMLLKLLLIGLISLILLIPQQIILHVVNERNATSAEAEEEVEQMWSAPQRVIGPVVRIPGKNYHKDVYLLPETLQVKGDVKTEKRHRGNFDVTVYTADLTLDGNLQLPDLSEYVDSVYDLSKAEVLISLSDFRGLSENVVLRLNGKEYTMKSDKDEELGSVLCCRVPVSEMQDSVPATYSVRLPLKGSEWQQHLRAADLQLRHAELPGQLPAGRAHGDGQRVLLDMEGAGPQPRLRAVSDPVGGLRRGGLAQRKHEEERIRGDDEGAGAAVPADHTHREVRLPVHLPHLRHSLFRGVPPADTHPSCAIPAHRCRVAGVLHAAALVLRAHPLPLVVPHRHADDHRADHGLLGGHPENPQDRADGGCATAPALRLHVRAAPDGDLRPALRQPRYLRDSGGADVRVAEGEVVQGVSVRLLVNV